MTIWIAAVQPSSSEDTHGSDVGSSVWTPPCGFKLLKRQRPLNFVMAADCSIECNLFKLGFEDAADDVFWVGGSQHDEDGMTEERQDRIHQFLARTQHTIEHNYKSNLMGLWYLPRGLMPDTADGMRLPLNTRVITGIRCNWLLSR